MKAKCPCCGFPVQCYVPRGGDGSALQLRKHMVDNKRCAGTWHLVEWSEVQEPNTAQQAKVDTE